MKSVLLCCFFSMVFFRVYAQQIQRTDAVFTYPKQLSTRLPNAQKYREFSDEEKLIYFVAAIYLVSEFEGPFDPEKHTGKWILPPSLELFLFQKSYAFAPIALTLSFARPALLRIGPILSSLAGLLSRKIVMPATEQTLRIATIVGKQKKILDQTARLAQLKKNGLNKKEISFLKSQIESQTRALSKDIDSYRQAGGNVNSLADAGSKVQKSWASKIGSLALAVAGTFAISEIFDRIVSDDKPKIPYLDTADYAMPVRLGEDGSPCVYGLYASSLSKTNGQLKCQTPKLESSTCKKGDFICPNFGIVGGNLENQKKFCTPDTGRSDDMSARCGTIFINHLKALIDGKAGASATTHTNLTLKEASLLQLVALVKSIATKWENERLPSGNSQGKISITQYCSDTKSPEVVHRQRECQAIKTFVTHLKSTQVYESLFADTAVPIDDKNPPSVKQNK